MTQLERRRIEAEMLAQVHETLCRRLGPEQALAVVAETTERAAMEAGAAFARSAPDGPSLAHFATVADIWRAGGALDIRDECLGDEHLGDERLGDERPGLPGGTWSFAVTRCAYADMYLRDMGLPPELAFVLSCGRDAAFARGYHPALRLERSETIAQGNGRCEFCFLWSHRH